MSPANGLSGLTRGEQRCASGAACAASFDVAGTDGRSVKVGGRGVVGDGNDGIVAGGRSGGVDGMGASGGLYPPGGDGDGVVIITQPCRPFG